MNGNIIRLASLTLALVNCCAGADLVVDASKVVGTFRPLHGVNNGPLDGGGTIDLSDAYREAGIPLVRLHDVHWPNADVVDMHVVFPDPAADPSRPESYNFARTDEYLKAIAATGAKIVYRLGESIEHTKTKYHVHPPVDPDRWAAACAGIIRHCNEGWAGGLHLDIRDWEIWNEPENRPAMWTGTDDAYFRLYAATARAIRARFPDLRVGGPAVGDVGRVRDGHFEPSAFVTRFLDVCRRESLPLDFFAWHQYPSSPRLLGELARGVRAELDGHGFTRTLSYLDEWNYLPDGDWSSVLGGQGRKRQRFYERQGGAEGAAFIACALLGLQDSPVDQACFYAGDTNLFGLFNVYGTPKKTYGTFRAFHGLLDAPIRLEATGGNPDTLAVAAGTDAERTGMVVLVGDSRSNEDTIHLAIRNAPWHGPVRIEAQRIDAEHDLDPVAITPDGPIRWVFSSRGPAVTLIRLQQDTGAGAVRAEVRLRAGL